jgi:hypothetical protein
MSDKKSVDAKQIQPKATATPVPKLSKPIMAVPGLQQTAPAAQQGQPFDFSKVHVHFAVPCYGGMVSEPTMTSFLRFTLMAAKIGLNWSLDTMVNESLVTRARNNLCAKMMMNKEATHFMFIDADIRFDPEAIFGMIACDKDVIGGLYPKKSLPIDYVINLKNGGRIEGPIFQVDTQGTGFLLFKKHVYEKLIAAHPECKYVDDIGIGKQFEPFMYSIFDTIIDERGHYLSEDWTFCRRWQALGGDIWADSRVLLNHIGHYEFKGDLEALERKGLKRVDVNTPEGKAAVEAQMKAIAEAQAAQAAQNESAAG